MLLLRGNGRGRDVWRAQSVIRCGTTELLDALTDPDEITRWAPVRFEVEGLAGERLGAGGCERVTGTFAGISTAFDVEVHQADLHGLELIARGPVALEVSYRFEQHDEGVLVRASIRVTRQPGLTGHLLAAALAALLDAGALNAALNRLERSLWRPAEAELIAV